MKNRNLDFVEWLRTQLKELECPLSAISDVSTVSRTSITSWLLGTQTPSENRVELVREGIAHIRRIRELTNEEFTDWLNKNLEEM